MRALAGIAAVTLLGGCASGSLLLLPDEEGGTGSVAVLESGGTARDTLVDAPNTRTSLGSARPSVRAINPGAVSAQERALIDYLPKPPATYTLYFVEGTTRLTAPSRRELDNIKREIALRPGAEVQVTGHTDTLGNNDDNDRLSMQRAQEILGVLAAEEGIDRALMTAVGRGERALKVRTADGERNAENRRVEVIVR